jgi:hypothetical protein
MCGNSRYEVTGGLFSNYPADERLEFPALRRRHAHNRSADVSGVNHLAQPLRQRATTPCEHTHPGGVDNASTCCGELLPFERDRRS